MVHPGIDKGNIIEYLADIFLRRGADSYLGEEVSMAEHMLQTALNAEQAGESKAMITAALLHDIGHYVGEFPENYIDLGMDNHHETLGAAILEKFFPREVTEPVRWHVEAKRYLCAVDPAYLGMLSSASMKTLALQGGPLEAGGVAAFEKNVYLESILRLRQYDDRGKTAGVRTPQIGYYLEFARDVLE